MELSKRVSELAGRMQAAAATSAKPAVTKELEKIVEDGPAVPGNWRLAPWTSTALRTTFRWARDDGIVCVRQFAPEKTTLCPLYSILLPGGWLEYYAQGGNHVNPVDLMVQSVETPGTGKK